MKIIDLLNKIANAEEVKAKLKFKLGDIIITYYGQDNYYHTPEYNIEYITTEFQRFLKIFSGLIRCWSETDVMVLRIGSSCCGLFNLVRM